MTKYMCVEDACGKIFSSFGKILTKWPLVAIACALAVAGILGTGLTRLEFETDIEKLYTPQNSKAVQDRNKLKTLYESRSGYDFYEHQLPDLGVFGEVIFMTKPNGRNVLSEEILKDVMETYEYINDTKLDVNGQIYTYQDVCARRFGNCVVDGALFATELFELLYKRGLLNFPVISDVNGQKTNLATTLAGVKLNPNGTVLSAEALRIQFNLKQDTVEEKQLAFKWENAFIERMKNYKTNSSDFTFQASQSLGNELNQNTGGDIQFFSITFTVMITYVSFVSSGGNCVSTRAHLARAGVLSTLLAILASFGLCSFCGVRFVNIVGVMPYLVLGIGIDDMFILMASFRRTDPKQAAEKRISETFRMAGLPISVTTLTSVLAFCISALNDFISIRNFCIYTGTAIFFCYLFHLMFFGGCLVYHTKRVEQSRHCCTCQVTESKEKMKERKAGAFIICFCAGQRSTAEMDDGSVCESAPSKWLHKVILNRYVKPIIILAFSVYLGFAIWGAFQIKEGLELNNLLPEFSYLNKLIDKRKIYFGQRGAVVSFTIDQPIKYWETGTYNDIVTLLGRATDSKYCINDFQISWLSDYLAYLKRKNITNPSESTFLSVLQTEFLPIAHSYKNDIKFGPQGKSIVTSRFYVQSKGLNSSSEEGLMMLHLRYLAQQSTLPVFAYTGAFIFYEQYVSIFRATLQTCGIALGAMFLVGLIFIPHPLSTIIVLVTMVMILAGMFGFMHFWGLTLSAITMIQVVLSIGFCVDFSAHVCHAFMQADGSRQERAAAAISKVGVPILNSAISSFLGICLIAFSKSYVFQSFFKTMFLVVVLGLGHALFLLPVILSYIGPPKPQNKTKLPSPTTSQSAETTPDVNISELTPEESVQNTINSMAMPNTEKHEGNVNGDLRERSSKSDDNSDIARTQTWSTFKSNIEQNQNGVMVNGGIHGRSKDRESICLSDNGQVVNGDVTLIYI